MPKEYVYHNYIWKNIYGNINSNRIYPRFKKGEQFANGFYSITFNCVALPNYTIKDNETKLYLSIKDIGEGFEFTSHWFATKMKGAFLETIFDEIVNQGKIENEYINWRGGLFRSLLEIKEKATDLKLIKTSENKIEFSFKVHLSNLQATFEPDNFLDPKFIVDLGNKSPKDIILTGLKYLDVDDKKCIGILKTIIEEIPIAGIIIGIAYFNEGKSELSNRYILKALNEIDAIDLEDDLIGIIAEVIATNELNLGVTNDRTIRLFFEVLNINQSGTALIKLSYLILSRNIKHLKEFALENVSIAIEYNLKDDNEATKIAGFHVICSILIWNNKFDIAEEYHHYFLKDNTDFYVNYFEHIESYLTLAIVKNNANFISNLILDFPHLKIKAKDLFEVWMIENEVNFNHKFSPMEFFYYQKISNARKLYC